MDDGWMKVLGAALFVVIGIAVRHFAKIDRTVDQIAADRIRRWFKAG